MREAEVIENTSGPGAGDRTDQHSVRDEAELTLLGLLILIGVHRKPILLTSFVVAVLALGIALLLPNEYEASCTLLPPQQTPSSSALMSQLGNLSALAGISGGSVGLKNPADMYVALLKSRSVEDAMIERFHLMDRYKQKYMNDARKAVGKTFVIEAGAKDGLIRITVRDRDPKMAAALVNGYVEEYQKFSAHLAVTEASQRRLFFEREMEKSKNDLANAEEALKRTETSSGVIQLDSQSRALIESVAALRAQISAKEVQIQALSASETDSNPEIQVAREQLAGLENQLKQLGANSDMLVPHGQISSASLDYVRKLRDVKYYEVIFELLAKQFEAAKIDEAREGSIIQVVDPGVVPDRKASPHRALIVLGGAFLGFLLAIARALFQSARARIGTNADGKSGLANFREAWRFNSRQA
jgi:tyrosine-protein kinase Etk/Wzc